ncbi:MAG: DUF554 domain-containing protein [Clostridia bacterium]|nr:DUF554 domain-containing protein [Clostridia bacterium]
MPGLGTVINAAAIILGGLIGLFFGKLMKDKMRDSLCKACGICVLFIGLAGALDGMLELSESDIVSGKSMLLIGCIAIGTLIGEIINLEDRFETFGEWLKNKTGNSGDKLFVEGFVNASLTVCIGAMAIVGSIQDGILGDISILVTKAILDFIIILIMAGSQGVGCVFSALPVAILQGSVTVLSTLIKPIMTAAALSNLSLIGSVLIFCVGINLVFGKKIRVANLLPSVIIAVIAAFI